VEAAIRAGAPGAKLSGAGLGGHIIAHVHRGDGDRVGSALAAAGARSVIMTELTPSANAA
jgi:mevalonate kinase